MLARLATTLFFGLCGGVSCGGLHIPNSPPSFAPEEMVGTFVEGIQLQARPIEGRDGYWDHFDDNLPEIGIVAIWVAVRNNRHDSIDLRDVEWTLRLGNKRHRALEVSKLMDLYYDGRKIRMYGTNSDRRTRRNLSNISFNPGSISPDLARDGFVFFHIDPRHAPGWNQGAILQAQEIRLEDKRRIEVAISLTHGNP